MNRDYDRIWGSGVASPVCPTCALILSFWQWGFIVVHNILSDPNNFQFLDVFICDMMERIRIEIFVRETVLFTYSCYRRSVWFNFYHFSISQYLHSFSFILSYFIKCIFFIQLCIDKRNDKNTKSVKIRSRRKENMW